MSRANVSDLMVVKAVAQYRRDHSRFPYELLAEWTGEPEKVCYRALERADEHGLIDWGVSLRTAWLTDKGKVLLAERTPETSTNNKPIPSAEDNDVK